MIFLSISFAVLFKTDGHCNRVKLKYRKQTLQKITLFYTHR